MLPIPPFPDPAIRALLWNGRGSLCMRRPTSNQTHFWAHGHTTFARAKTPLRRVPSILTVPHIHQALPVPQGLDDKRAARAAHGFVDGKASRQP